MVFEMIQKDRVGVASSTHSCWCNAIRAPDQVWDRLCPDAKWKACLPVTSENLLPIGMTVSFACWNTSGLVLTFLVQGLMHAVWL